MIFFDYYIYIPVCVYDSKKFELMKIFITGISAELGLGPSQQPGNAPYNSMLRIKQNYN